MTKRVDHPAHCLWCDQIKVGTLWMAERRASGEGMYTDGVCPVCQTDYLLDSLYTGL